MKKLNTQSKTVKKKPWVKYCFIASVVLIVFAGILYVTQGVLLSREFGWSKDYYGAAFEELYRLTTPDKEMKQSVFEQAEEAFSFIGLQQEAEERFGKLSGYCGAKESYPEAASAEYTLDLIAGKTESDEGYLWVAYTYRLYDEKGELLSASGSEDCRCLARWTVEKTATGWTVTAIKEHP